MPDDQWECMELGLEIDCRDRCRGRLGSGNQIEQKKGGCCPGEAGQGWLECLFQCCLEDRGRGTLGGCCHIVEAMAAGHWQVC